MAMAEPERIGAMVLEEVPPMPRDEVDVAEDIEPSAPLGSECADWCRYSPIRDRT